MTIAQYRLDEQDRSENELRMSEWVLLSVKQEQTILQFSESPSIRFEFLQIFGIELLMMACMLEQENKPKGKR
jgi:hypothetical protein